MLITIMDTVESLNKLVKEEKRKSNYNDKKYYREHCGYGDPPPTVIGKVERIIAIGDIHGDLSQAVRAFELASLIDLDEAVWKVGINRQGFNGIKKHLKWLGGQTHVVQVGDQVDSCREGKTGCTAPTKGDYENDLDVIYFFDYMHSLAQNYGGAVISLLGNHELMNVIGDFTYVSYANKKYYNHSLLADDNLFDYINADVDLDDPSYAGESGRKKSFARGGPVARYMACTRPSIVTIGSYMFAHAGILPSLLNHLDHDNSLTSQGKLEYLNYLMRRWLIDYSYNNTKVQNLLTGEDSPFWQRVYGNIEEYSTVYNNSSCKQLDMVLRFFKLKGMVIGHTPQEDGIIGTCDDKLWQIDVGASFSFSKYGYGNIKILEIKNDTEFAIIED